jgi:hypothetical protein
MHAQLPETLLTEIERGANEARPEAPDSKAVVLDRVVLNRPGRKVKFYFRKNRHKRCYSELTDAQVKALFIAVHKNARGQAVNFIFDDDHYLVTPETKRLVK